MGFVVLSKLLFKFFISYVYILPLLIHPLYYKLGTLLSTHCLYDTFSWTTKWNVQSTRFRVITDINGKSTFNIIYTVLSARVFQYCTVGCGTCMNFMSVHISYCRDSFYIVVLGPFWTFTCLGGFFSWHFWFSLLLLFLCRVIRN